MVECSGIGAIISKRQKVEWSPVCGNSHTTFTPHNSFVIFACITKRYRAKVSNVQGNSVQLSEDTMYSYNIVQWSDKCNVEALGYNKYCNAHFSIVCSCTISTAVYIAITNACTACYKCTELK